MWENLRKYETWSVEPKSLSWARKRLMVLSKKNPNDCTLCRANGAGRVGCTAMIALLCVCSLHLLITVSSQPRALSFQTRLVISSVIPGYRRLAPVSVGRKREFAHKKPRCHIEWCWQKPKVSHQKLIRYQSPLVPHHNRGTKLFAHPDVCMFHTHLQSAHCTPGPGRGNRVGDMEN